MKLLKIKKIKIQQICIIIIKLFKNNSKKINYNKLLIKNFNNSCPFLITITN